MLSPWIVIPFWTVVSLLVAFYYRTLLYPPIIEMWRDARIYCTPVLQGFFHAWMIGLLRRSLWGEDQLPYYYCGDLRKHERYQTGEILGLFSFIMCALVVACIAFTTIYLSLWH